MNKEEKKIIWKSGIASKYMNERRLKERIKWLESGNQKKGFWKCLEIFCTSVKLQERIRNKQRERITEPIREIDGRKRKRKGKVQDVKGRNKDKEKEIKI